jgi:protein-S-isoprenylcysteine O-methyltransferase Ste14
MFLLDVAIAVVATVVTTFLLVWAKRKRQAVPISNRSDAVDTMLALGLVILFLVSFSALTVAMMSAFGNGPIALIAAAPLYVAIIAATLYTIGRSNSVGSLAPGPNI